MMNSRRNFLQKSSMAGALILTTPHLLVAKGHGSKSPVFQKFRPTGELSVVSPKTFAGEIGEMIFSRNSPATYFNSKGLLIYDGDGSDDSGTIDIPDAYTQDFNDSTWIRDGISLTSAGSGSAPDGSGEATKLTEQDGLSQHRLTRNIVVTQGEAHTFSIHIKAGTCTKARISFSNYDSYTEGNPKLIFDMTLGAITYQSDNVVNSSVKDMGNGWWRVSISGVPDLSELSGSHIFLMNDRGNITYSGSKNRTAYIWGAQFEAGSSPTNFNPDIVPATSFAAAASPGGYGPRYNYDPFTKSLKGLMVEAQATNVLLFSDVLSGWDKRFSIIKANQTMSPDGVGKAIKLIEGSNTISHYMLPKIAPKIERGQIYTFSVFLKAGERKWAYFMVNGLTVHFDLDKGEVGKLTENSAFIDSGVQNVGNDWFRCRGTIKATSSTMALGIGLEVSNGNKVYNGNGESGIYVWGPQLEKGIYMTSYIPTTIAAVTREDENCALSAPTSSDPYDVFIQRTNGGTWIDNVNDSYKLPYSRFEVQNATFLDAGVSDTDKEKLAKDLYPEKYVFAGYTSTEFDIFGNDYRIQSANKDWSVRVANNKTAMMYRFEVRSGDQWVSDAGKPKERSELYCRTKMPFNKDVWLSYAVKVAEGAPASSSFCHLGQFHATEDPLDVATVPILTFRFKGEDNLSITTCSNTQNPLRENSTGVIRYEGKLPRGKWIRNVMRIRFSPFTNDGQDGQLEWWENGVKKLDLKNIGIGNRDAVGPYWKFGVYRASADETIVAEYANMELSLDSLRSRITQPLLII